MVKEKNIEAQIKDLVNALPDVYEGLADATWRRTKKYCQEQATMEYLKNENADSVGLVELLTSYNSDLPKPFEDNRNKRQLSRKGIL